MIPASARQYYGYYPGTDEIRTVYASTEEQLTALLEQTYQQLMGMLLICTHCMKISLYLMDSLFSALPVPKT